MNEKISAFDPVEESRNTTLGSTVRWKSRLGGGGKGSSYVPPEQTTFINKTDRFSLRDDPVESTEPSVSEAASSGNLRDHFLPEKDPVKSSLVPTNRELHKINKEWDGDF